MSKRRSSTKAKSSRGALNLFCTNTKKQTVDEDIDRPYADERQPLSPAPGGLSTAGASSYKYISDQISISTPSTGGTIVNGGYDQQQNSYQHQQPSIQQQQQQRQQQQQPITKQYSGEPQRHNATHRTAPHRPPQQQQPRQVSQPTATVINSRQQQYQTIYQTIKQNDSLDIDEFLWKYVEKFHSRELNDIGAGRAVRVNYSPATHRLELSSVDRQQSVVDTSERITKLCQSLSPVVVDSQVSVPPGLQADVFTGIVSDLADRNQCVHFFDIELRHHVAGSKQNVETVKRRIGDFVHADQTAVARQQTTAAPPAPLKMDMSGGIHVEIYQGNLLDEKVGAIVNPANPYLSNGGGAAKAIADAAGRQLVRECRDYIKKYGELKFGEVTHTNAGKLSPRIQYVIHASGPPASEFPNQDDLFNTEVATFDNCLIDAEHLKVKSIAIPAIGAGIYGVPRHVAAAAAFDAVMRFDQTPRRYVNEIHFVNLDAETTVAFIEAFSVSRSRGRTAGGAKGRRSRSQDPRPRVKDLHLQQQQQAMQVSGAAAALVTTARAPVNQAAGLSATVRGGDTGNLGLIVFDPDPTFNSPFPNDASLTRTQRTSRLHPAPSSNVSPDAHKATISPAGKTPPYHYQPAAAATQFTFSPAAAPAAVLTSTQRRPINPTASANTTISLNPGDCVICMSPMDNPKKLPCGHKFCTDCIDESFKQCQPKCPCCGRLCGTLRGNQPPGTMTVRHVSTRLAGYSNCNAIEIQYSIPNGIQDDRHPNPGQPYYGTRRTAYLPNNAEGNKVYELLRLAFDAELIFTVGRSVTNGRDNSVVWNDIHHKTSPTGPYGYPDPTYLSRITDELKSKGIGSDPIANSSPPNKTGKRKKVDTAAAAGDLLKTKRAGGVVGGAHGMDGGGRQQQASNLTVTSSIRTTKTTKKKQSLPPVLKDTIDVEDYLWRYVEKYRRQELKDICGAGTKYTYSRATQPTHLVVESIDGQSVADRCEKIGLLIRDLSQLVVDETLSVPQGVPADTVKKLAKDLAESNECIYYVDQQQLHRVIGPVPNVQHVKQQISNTLTGARKRTRADIQQQQTAATAAVANVNSYQISTRSGLQIDIHSGNLLDEKVEAIVSPTNAQLTHGGGVSKIIALKAGEQLWEQCAQYIQRSGPLHVSDVMYTTAGNFGKPVNYVIHAVGPSADQFPDRTALYNLSVDTFYNCLDRANDLKARSVAIPAIGSGINGVPRPMVADAAYEAVMKFDRKFAGGNRYLSEIRFVNLEDVTTYAFIEEFSVKMQQQLSSKHHVRPAAAVAALDSRGAASTKRGSGSRFYKDTGENVQLTAYRPRGRAQQTAMINYQSPNATTVNIVPRDTGTAV